MSNSININSGYDVVVIGAGHAGCEAALASAKLGCKVAIFTLSLDTIANLPCNPSIGGTAKGTLVYEIDALGGEMGRAADATSLQSRTLNKGKGPAVHSLRMQIDRVRYHQHMKMALEHCENIDIKQAEVVKILTEDDRVCGIETSLGAKIPCKAAIISTGTYLMGRIHVGELSYESGPDNVMPATKLTESLMELGVSMRRFKTGTPARVHRRSIDFSELELQPGDYPAPVFSADTKGEIENKLDCYIAYTNELTHEVIRKNLLRSPMYSGRIEGVGPRYCPSIEDKVVRFADKQRHQIFIEPMGMDTNELYLQGVSSSLPEEVQIEFLRTIKGLENVSIMRTGYAIEYDCADPTQLLPTLEFMKIRGLYGAGQFNGSSGYEEAAAQGLLAGINAVAQITDKEPLILDRASSYIGTLVDDLVTKGCNDPYRMMTSRSEYRLTLRQDNAEERLTPIGYERGLISQERYDRYIESKTQLESELKRLWKLNIAPSKALNELLTEVGTAPISTGIKAAELIRRPQVTYDMLAPFDKDRTELSEKVKFQVEVSIKYEGYINKQSIQIEEMRRLENKALPKDFDYCAIKGLRIEAVEKLNRIAPLNIGQASRISGVSPADISVLLIWLAAQKPRRGN